MPTPFKKCTTPGAIYSFGFHGNKFNALVTFPTLRYINVPLEEFDRIVHDALEEVLTKVTFDSKNTSSNSWEHHTTEMQDEK